MTPRRRISTSLWFDDNAEEAVQFYVSLFEDSRITQTLRYGDAGPGPNGSIMAMQFELQGQRFEAINGGPHFQLTPAVSIAVTCDSQEEVDRLWHRLLDGGQAQQCGWLTDRFGLCWQIVPGVLGKMLADPDSGKSDRVMKSMLGMVKLDTQVLQRAYDGTEA